ncbi:MAG: 6-phosphogluconolactonase [Thermoanaerobaculia bacterium]
MNTRIFDSTEDLVAAAARTIVQRVEGGARSIALSGGTTPPPLYTLLGSDPLRQILAPFPIIWVVVDERYVPIDHPDSNAGMIEASLFATGMASDHTFLRFRTELGDPEATARQFEADYLEQGVGDLDIALLGMGDDGHTASLFPGTSVLAVEDRMAAAVHVPRLDAWRVTLTKPVLRAAKLRLVLATGVKKRSIIEQIRSGADYPIAEVTNSGETWWFLDQEAAGERTGRAED